MLLIGVVSRCLWKNVWRPLFVWLIDWDNICLSPIMKFLYY